MARLYLCISKDSDGNKIIKGITCNKGMMKKFCREQSDGTFLEIPSQDLFYKILDSTFDFSKDSTDEVREARLDIKNYSHKFDEPVDENGDEPEIPVRFIEKQEKQRAREARKQGKQRGTTNSRNKSRMKR